MAELGRKESEATLETEEPLVMLLRGLLDLQATLARRGTRELMVPQDCQESQGWTV